MAEWLSRCIHLHITMCEREKWGESVDPADTPVPPRKVVVFAILLKAVEAGPISIYIHIYKTS